MPKFLPWALCAVTACSLGTRVSSFDPATGPQGVFGTISTRDTTLRAEVLAVSDTALIVVRAGNVELVSYAAITYASFAQLGSSYDIENGHPPDAATLERLRLLSRFPQGVTPELLRQLLAAYHDDSLRVRPP